MSEKRKITLKDIARELGISVSTASRALRSHHDISADTIKLVKDFAELHHYVPNFQAVNFRKSRTYTIGIIVPELVHHFFSTIISGAIVEAGRRGFNVLVSQSNDTLEGELKAARSLLAGSVDGLLVSISNETIEGEHFREFLDEGKPVVQFDKVSDRLDTPKVIVDDFNGSYQAVSHLVSQGYKKIAHIGGRKDVKNSIDRFEGFKKAVTDNNLVINNYWIYTCVQISEEEGFEFTKQLMESNNPPDAIFCITDLVAWGAIKYLNQAGYRIPDQVGVVGFSNWKLAEVMGPSLSSVDQHGYEIGTTATRVLIDLIEKQDIDSHEVYEINTNLVVRESSKRN
jgi:LacI family transcriptional regulator